MSSTTAGNGEIMSYVSVCEDEPGYYVLDLEPEVWMARQYEVTQEEFAELVLLKAQFRKYQELLRSIREDREEVDRT
jgi:hypothetical protein